MDIKKSKSTLESRNFPFQEDNASFLTLLWRFLKTYWRTLFIIIWLLVTLPIFLLNDTLAFRCLYSVVIMGMFWITEALPLPVTGLIPVVLYPLMGILSTSDTCICYMNSTIMIFIGSIMIAIAVETSGIHIRIALLIIKFIGCSHRRLSFGLFCVTTLISLWISNTATTALMIPIVETILTELQEQGAGDMFTIDEDNPKDENGEPVKKPTNTTIAYYLGAAYASSIAGTGTIIGTGTNLSFKGIYETRFPNSPGISFASWMLYSMPPMLLCNFLTWMWLQVMYMGMFRPNSKDAKAINIGKRGEEIARAVIVKKYKELGPLKWNEACVGVLFLLAICLWFFSEPGFMTGWSELVSDVAIQDGSIAIFIVFLFFIIPEKPDFINAFSKDPAKRPVKASPGLITWKAIETKMHWGLMFLIGGGFAIASGSTSSGLATQLGEALVGLRSLDKLLILFVVCLAVENITELTANVAIVNILLPVVAEMCVAIEVHPLYLMMPTTLCCSFSFHLPSSTPPNAIARESGHISTKDIVIGGIGPSIITLVTTVVAFSTWGNYIFDLNEFPEWAITNSTTS